MHVCAHVHETGIIKEKEAFDLRGSGGADEGEDLGEARRRKSDVILLRLTTYLKKK